MPYPHPTQQSQLIKTGQRKHVLQHSRLRMTGFTSVWVWPGRLAQHMLYCSFNNNRWVTGYWQMTEWSSRTISITQRLFWYLVIKLKTGQRKHVLQHCRLRITGFTPVWVWPGRLAQHMLYLPSVLTLLVGRQEGHPVCKKLSGGVLAWLSVWS